MLEFVSVKSKLLNDLLVFDNTPSAQNLKKQTNLTLVSKWLGEKETSEIHIYFLWHNMFYI